MQGRWADWKEKGRVEEGRGDTRDNETELEMERDTERQEIGRERDRASQSFWGCPATKAGAAGGHHTQPAFTRMLGYPDSGPHFRQRLPPQVSETFHQLQRHMTFCSEGLNRSFCLV